MRDEATHEWATLVCGGLAKNGRQQIRSLRSG